MGGFFMLCQHPLSVQSCLYLAPEGFLKGHWSSIRFSHTTLFLLQKMHLLEPLPGMFSLEHSLWLAPSHPPSLSFHIICSEISLPRQLEFLLFSPIMAPWLFSTPCHLLLS